MAYQPCGCWEGPWMSVTAPPRCGYHNGSGTWSQTFITSAGTAFIPSAGTAYPVDNLTSLISLLEIRMTACEMRLRELDPEADGHGYEHAERMSVKWAERALIEMKVENAQHAGENPEITPKVKP